MKYAYSMHVKQHVTFMQLYIDCLTNLNKNRSSYHAMLKVSRNVILQSNSIRQEENNKNAK